MDLKNLETTTTYAIEALYREYWDIIPERYKLLERAQRPEHGNFPEEYYNNLPPSKRKSNIKPLTYSDVEKYDEPKKDYQTTETDYRTYCEELNKDQFFNFYPFYDPELNFENRLHYKLVGVSYPKRNFPWYVITWNCGQGLLNSSLTRRRFETKVVETPAGDKVKFDFIDTDLDLTMAIYSNDMQALFELQENIVVGRREKFVVYTRPHSIVGSFPVAVNTIGSTLSKLSRDRGTLCQMMLFLKIDYPIIGNVKAINGGIIEEIHLEVDKEVVGETSEPEVLGRNIINEDNP